MAPTDVNHEGLVHRRARGGELGAARTPGSPRWGCKLGFGPPTGLGVAGTPPVSPGTLQSLAVARRGEPGGVMRGLAAAGADYRAAPSPAAHGPHGRTRGPRNYPGIYTPAGRLGSFAGAGGDGRGGSFPTAGPLVLLPSVGCPPSIHPSIHPSFHPSCPSPSFPSHLHPSLLPPIPDSFTHIYQPSSAPVT